VTDAGVWHILGVWGAETAERTSSVDDSLRVAVVVDAYDELITGGVDVGGVIDDVDLTQRPEVTDRVICGLVRDVTTVRYD